ncbi:MAG: hypothetical protein FWD88_01890, partial [Treponema sp.]|nr:hypothetical protein [Treponema sp.]
GGPRPRGGGAGPGGGAHPPGGGGGGETGPGGGGGNRPWGWWEHGYWNRPDWNRSGPWDHPEWFRPDRDIRRGQSGGIFPRRNSWVEDVARVAIAGFSHTMDQEFAPWITVEERNLRRGGRNEPPQLEEAIRLARMGLRDQALRIYLEVYGQYGNVLAGFNAAILLAANGKLPEALELLEGIHRGLGQNTPRFVTREIQRMAVLVEGFRKLEEYRANRVGTPGPTTVFAPTPGPTPPPRPANIPVMARNEPANAREVRGTVNLNPAQIYALSDSIAYAEDASIWSKIVASTDADAHEGQWSMRIPATAPSLLWFVVVDGRHGLYITQTPLNTTESIVLNTARMTRLE